ncbi:MAG: hypothetical protein HYZ01_06350 [Ignavibacteriales bacterium]|nr:hypothetical protein [Ignavibacteriales bacterium]
MKTLIALGLSVVLSSCMHLGMMGAHGDQPSGEHRGVPGSLLEKEVTAGNVKATAIFPPLVLGRETVFELRLQDTQTRLPLSGAQVSFHATYQHRADQANQAGHAMHSTMDSMLARPTMDHAVSVDREIQEGPQPGIYAAHFTPSQSGEYILMFHVSAVGDEQLEPELIIEGTRSIASGDATHGGAMHGMGSVTEYAIIGGALMGAAMIVMWATRGWMF